MTLALAAIADTAAVLMAVMSSPLIICEYNNAGHGDDDVMPMMKVMMVVMSW